MTDTFTLSHLDKWIADQFHSDDPVDDIHIAMLKKVNEDEEYWLNHSWWDVYYAADCGALVRAADQAIRYRGQST